ncbi:uncharacterized protein LOC127012042 [Drosophila biarmipes]|uniref:uncharacterized protein LOC127012042 n=1 Tax=Drosophila biarmipes TaxID=125945 RepID=UPI0021CD056D|nr:uncharacterized protein LOC127012042 [Drosophila biarmipes]
MMLPIEVTESTDPIDETEEIRRRKRSIELNHKFNKNKEDEHRVMMLPIELTESTDPIDKNEEVRRRKRSIELNHKFNKVRIRIPVSTAYRNIGARHGLLAGQIYSHH